MTVTNVQKDTDKLTLDLTAEFDATPERVWQLWADPRQLERWWGPPTYPATFTKHDLAPGSRVEYYMTGPEGDTPHGYWDIVESEPPRYLNIRDGFANEDGTNNDEMPGPGVQEVRIMHAQGLASSSSLAQPFGRSLRIRRSVREGEFLHAGPNSDP